MSMSTAGGVTILKGPTFAARLAQVCGEPLPVEPAAGLKHKRVLIPHLVGGEAAFAQMGILGQALRMRGAEVTALLCDALLPACTMRKADHYESACRRWCYKNAGPFAQALGLPHCWHSKLITAEEQAECRRLAAGVAPRDLLAFEFRGIDLGPHLARSIESYFKVGHFDLDDADVVLQARKFLVSGMYQTIIGNRALDELRIDKVLMDDGKKVDWGVVRAVAAQKGIPVDVVWRGLRGLSIRFERDVPGRGSLPMPEWEIWRDRPLTPAQQEELDQYLLRRETLPYDFRPDWRVAALAGDEVRRLVGLPEQTSGLVFGMFPNVGFDAGKTTRNPAFHNINDWIFGTVEHFRSWPQHHLVIKVHPAEARRQAGDQLIPCVTARCHPVPPNVHLLPPDSTVAAGSVVRILDCALVYTSTVGVEASARGVPVVVAGGGWNACRGFTTDVTSPREYFELLTRICQTGQLPPNDVELARRYAYALCFRSNLDIAHFDLLDFNVKSLNIDSLADLAPGRDPVMDIVCRGILNDEPFEAPATTCAPPVLSAT